MKQLNESLDYLDMQGHVTPIVGIDEYKSKVGQDSDIIVLNFLVSGKAVGNDLVEWFERGYEWVIDSDVSPGEVLGGKYMVFAEMNRRSSAPKRIIEALEDLKTLTGLKLSDWQVKIDGKKMPASLEAIEHNVILNPNEYLSKQEQELNEWREIAGLKTVKTHEFDQDVINMQRQAGIR